MVAPVVELIVPRGPVVFPNRRSADRIVLAGLFLVGFCANIYFVSPGVAGVPYRFIYMVGLLGIISLFSTQEVTRAVTASRAVLIIVIYLGLVGFMLSALRGEAGAAAVDLISTHSQAIVIMLAATAGTIILGPRTMATMFAIAVGISVFFSVLQWLNVQPAIAARDLLGTVRADTADVADSIERAPGLSYSTIYLAQQACMVFALALLINTRLAERAGFGTRRPGLYWGKVVTWSILLAFVCFISGNRSPILGLFVFFSLVVSARNPRFLFLSVPVIIGFYFLIDPLRDLISGTGMRVGQTDDKSTLARTPLWIYGLRLLAARPIGYGLAFDSKALNSTVQTSDLYSFIKENLMADLFFTKDLHNYYIVLANIYGIFILPILVYFLRIFTKGWEISILFVPYMVHIFFHNAGPLADDYMIWVPLGVLIGTAELAARSEQS